MSKRIEDEYSATEMPFAENVEKEQIENQVGHKSPGKKVLTALNDVAVVVKQQSNKAMQKAEELKLDAERKWLQPVFDEELRTTGIPEMVRICKPDKRHLDSSVCEGSVGYYMDAKGMKVLNLYDDFAEDYGLVFYPSLAEDVYFRHPFDDMRYISLDDYFLQLRKEKVDELNNIAQALGACLVDISLMAEKKNYTGIKEKAAVKGKVKNGKDIVTSAEVSQSISYDNHSFKQIGVSAVTRFAGHAPTVPKLQYFTNDSAINSLITMCLNADNAIREQTYDIKYSDSSKIKAAAAAKIDFALKKMKYIGGNATVSAEVEEENRLHFAYHIEFPTKKK